MRKFGTKGGFPLAVKYFVVVEIVSIPIYQFYLTAHNSKEIERKISTTQFSCGNKWKSSLRILITQGKMMKNG